MSDHEKKLLEMRMQMSENQMYMQDCFSDLDKWAKEMKEKEQSLQNTASGSIEKVLVFILTRY